MRRNPIVGLAVPGRELHDRQIRRKKLQRTGQLLHPRTVTADHGEADRRRRPAGGDGPRQIREHESFGAVGDAGEKERPASGEALGRRSRG